MRSRTWAEVDLAALRQNLRVYRVLAGRDVMAVVKADAYGHGAVPVARALWEEGVCSFAVATAEEGIELRRAGLEGNILILGYTAPADAAELIRHDLTQAVVSLPHGEALARTGLPVKCHVALDTGMRRIGLDAADPAACEATVRRLDDCLKVTGLFTHLCAADAPDAESISFTRRQIELFEAIANRLKDLDLETHCLNSAGGLRYSTALPGPVRLGILLYGLRFDPDSALPEGLRPVLSWKSVVTAVRDLLPGDSIGYGRSFRAERPLKIATVAAGYADGVSRLLSNRGSVLIHGRRARIIGRVCMDQLMADITEIPGVAQDDPVTLLGRDGDEEICASEIASLTDTVDYEVVCRLSSRVTRVYREGANG